MIHIVCDRDSPILQHPVILKVTALKLCMLGQKRWQRDLEMAGRYWHAGKQRASNPGKGLISHVLHNVDGLKLLIWIGFLSWMALHGFL